MVNYLIRRLLMSVFLAVMLVAIVFFMLRTIVPGDPVLLLAGERATPEMIETIRRQQGLDKPLMEQFWIFLRNAIQGDLGRSVMTRQQVTDVCFSGLSCNHSIDHSEFYFFNDDRNQCRGDNCLLS